MAEKVARCGVQKEKGHLYYLGKDGNVWASRMARGSDKGGNAKNYQGGENDSRRSQSYYREKGYQEKNDQKENNQKNHQKEVINGDRFSCSPESGPA